eukprot:7530108-Pyramimonas_sp.AAC.1
MCGHCPAPNTSPGNPAWPVWGVPAGQCHHTVRISTRCQQSLSVIVRGLPCLAGRSEPNTK